MCNSREGSTSSSTHLIGDEKGADGGSLLWGSFSSGHGWGSLGSSGSARVPQHLSQPPHPRSSSLWVSQGTGSCFGHGDRVLDSGIVFWTGGSCSGHRNCVLDTGIVFWTGGSCSGPRNCVLDTGIMFWTQEFCSEHGNCILDTRIVFWTQAGRALGLGNEERRKMIQSKKAGKQMTKAELSCPKEVLNSACRCQACRWGFETPGDAARAQEDTVPCAQEHSWHGRIAGAGPAGRREGCEVGVSGQHPQSKPSDPIPRLQLASERERHRGKTSGKSEKADLRRCPAPAPSPPCGSPSTGTARSPSVPGARAHLQG